MNQDGTQTAYLHYLQISIAPEHHLQKREIQRPHFQVTLLFWKKWSLYNSTLEYLPVDKLQAPPKDDEDLKHKDDLSNESQNDKAENPSYKYLNVDIGLQYSADMEDMYKEILTMFCNLKDDKKSKIQEAFDNEDWNNYTTLIHALKSTSLSIGGEKTSELAKQLELAGKMCISELTSELEKIEGEKYIKEHHAETMESYDKLVDEGKRYLES